MGFSFTKREIRLQSGILHYKMGFLLYKRDSRVAIHPPLYDKNYLERIYKNNRFEHFEKSQEVANSGEELIDKNVCDMLLHKA